MYSIFYENLTVSSVFTALCSIAGLLIIHVGLAYNFWNFPLTQRIGILTASGISQD